MLLKPLLFIIITIFLPFGNGASTSTELSPLNNWERYYMVNHGCRDSPECATTEETCKYTKWSKWSNCSDVCAPLAEKLRTRTCRTDTCSSGICTFGSTTDTKTCGNLPCCKGFPKWSEWGEWNEPCGCGVLFHRRYHRCLRCEGKRCSGPYHEDEDCPDPCPQSCVEPSEWSHWAFWSRCNTPADRPIKCTRTRDRSCSTKDCLDGSPCVGVWNQTADYEDDDCWGGVWRWWAPWSTCNSDSCNTFTNRTRTRNCHIREAKTCTEGTRCPGQTEEIAPCITPCCSARTPSWSDWTEWTNCSRKCGHGTETRTRKCKGSKACLAQSTCLGEWKETRTCFNWCCDNVKLGQWTKWTPCKKSCGGTSKRKRKCKAKYCQYEKQQCATMKKEKRLCPKCT